jgi:hypothetical protein
MCYIVGHQIYVLYCGASNLESELFNIYLLVCICCLCGGLNSSDATCTREIKCRIHVAKVTFKKRKKKQTLCTNKLDSDLRKC